MGRKQTAETRAKIGKAQSERWRKARRDLGPLPELKRCSICRKWKDRLVDFYQEERRLRSGEVRFYAKGECKVCSAKRVAKWRADRKAEGTLNELERRYYQNRKNRQDPPPHPRERVDVQPMEKFLRKHFDDRIELLASRLNQSPEHLRKIKNGTGDPRISVEKVEKILIAADVGVGLRDLYPHLYQM